MNDPDDVIDVRGLTKRQVKDKLAALGVEWDAQGSGWVVVQEPAPGTSLTEVPLCRLVFSDSRNTPPVAPKATPATTAVLTALEPTQKP